MKMLSKLFFIMGFIIFFSVIPVQAVDKYDYVTYYTLTSEEITLAWDNTNTGVITFDVYIFRFEWNEVVVKYTDISITECSIILPRAGLYIFMVRAKRALTDSQITSVNAMNREVLLQFIQDNNIVDIVGDATDLTDQEIKDAVISAGKASTWAKSTTHGQVGGVDRGWWAYGYIAKPGPIVIGNVIKYYSHNKVL
jgi:hypothetical protein